MKPAPSFSPRPGLGVTQRELLGLVLRCATRGSSSFSQARHVAAEAIGDSEARALTRELLSDLAIRDWIELREEQPGGAESPVARLRYELELADDRNWNEHADEPRVRYALTDKGRAQVSAMLSTLRRPR
jgi:hypothetical protein